MDYADEALVSDPSSIGRKFFGYDCGEVDRRLTTLLQIVVDGKQVRKIQEGTIRTLEAQIEDYRESQALVRALFAQAEDQAKEIVRRAEEEAEAIRRKARDSEEEARESVARAAVEADAVRAEADRYVEEQRARVEARARDALRAVAFADNFEKIIGKPEIGGRAGNLLGKHILLFLRELGEATKDAAMREEEENPGEDYPSFAP